MGDRDEDAEAVRDDMAIAETEMVASMVGVKPALKLRRPDEVRAGVGDRDPENERAGETVAEATAVDVAGKVLKFEGEEKETNRTLLFPLSMM